MFSKVISTTVRRYAEMDDEKFRANRSCTKCNDRIWFFEIRSGRLKLYLRIFFSAIRVIQQLRSATSIRHQERLSKVFRAGATSPLYAVAILAIRSRRATHRSLSS